MSNEYDTKAFILVSVFAPAERISDVIESKNYFTDFSVLPVPKDDSLAGMIAYHPDMIISCVGNKIITAEKYSEVNSHLFACLKRSGFEIETEVLPMRGPVYPYDVSFNALVTDEFTVCNPEYASPLITSAENGRKIFAVNQGYSACSVLWLGNGAVTSDKGIERVLKENGIETLLISPGHITLPGYDYGFIGGASFCINDTVFTFGDLKYHPDADEIYDFLNKKRKSICALSDEPLYDLGGAVVCKCR